jgi:hypothetical protein
VPSALATSFWRDCALAFVVLLSAASCATRRVASPPPAAAVDDPAEIVPPDLDFVMRLDLGRVRDALGSGILDELRQRALRSGNHGAEPLTDVLAQADTLWLGARPGSSVASSDLVWVLRGNFADFDPHRGGKFALPDDLGGALRRYDHLGTTERADPARIYLHANDLVVVASVAELDSVERTLEFGRRGGALEPPSKGLVSLAIRPRALLGRLPAGTGQLRKLAERVLRIEGSADVTSAGLAVELALEFGDGEIAGNVARALGELKAALHGDERLGTFADRTSIEHVEAFVTAHVTLNRAELLGAICGDSCGGAGVKKPP